ncbi:chitin deacetylase 7-like isoform X1 [Octopus bimaculoides]|uniref:chitin deacetylase 7-like isoform X1 n=1 Tax=Octopus bimaculoides TaxID=37653 RepID=UPI0022E8ECAE|nr:chitin deacetylase 7-like isoform X1 [Octopus bimaculoides]XP_052823479.1 chitin deacetylase 7-like isoform X1 [Octopus bimaculoides]XP_052823480.1 chitin deacetylase 7-like isoform X1 [Octopus bimaculoides]
MEHSIHFFLVLLSVLSQSLPIDGCDPNMCRLPDCRCPGINIPGGHASSETPQIVMLTFDDAINEKNINYYHYLFGREKQSNLHNPNGCPIKSTFFITDVDNSYTLTNEIYQQGHEIASHTMTHKYPIEYWKNLSYTEYEKEVKGVTDKL